MPNGNRTLTAKAGAAEASGPDAQMAKPDPGRTTAEKPAVAAARATSAACAELEHGTKRQAGAGRCPARGARQAQKQRPERRKTTRPEKRAGTDLKPD